MHVLWDFDGTLFDTYPCYVRTLGEVLEGQVSETELLENMKISFGHTINHYQISTEMVEKYIEKENALPSESKPPFPHVEDVLKTVEINMIMTHKPRAEVEVLLDYYGWTDYFTEIVAGDDGFARKPDPESYRYLHEKYGIDLAVGDRALDLIPAAQIGIQTCYFCPDDHLKSEEAVAIADFVLPSYKDFLKVISG